MNIQTFGKYTITRQLGSGGMAEVYLAHDPMLDRNVAIKVIHPNLVSEADFEQGFRREARVVASLRHPNIVQVYEFDLYNGEPFMVMEYLEGGTLKDRLAEYRSRKETVPLEEARARLTTIASGLDYAHQRDLVHRDLKPGNILFTANGDPVIADFGIAKILGDPSQMTVSGKLVGTPAYMSPEQASSKAIDRRSDIYSLGVILYEMVAGTVPFKGESTTAVMMQHLTQPPPPPRQLNPAVPDAVQAVILKALAKNPDDRFATAGELASAFSTALLSGAAVSSPDKQLPVDPNSMTIIEPEAQTALRPAIPTPTPTAQAPVTPEKQVQLPPKAEAPIKAVSSPQPSRPAPDMVASPRTGQKRIAVAIAGAAIILVLLLVAGGAFIVSRLGNIGQPGRVASGVEPASGSKGQPTQTAPSAAALPTATQMAGMDQSNSSTGPQPGPTPQSAGILRFADAAGTADQVVLSLTNIPPPATGHQYEAWLVGREGEARVSLGKVELDKNGGAQLTFVDKDGQNLLAQFDRFELTLQPDPDPSTLPSGIVMYSSALPAGALMHIRHLLVAFDDTPNHIGLDVGLLKDAKLVNKATQDMSDAHQKSDFERVLIDAEILVNVIEGKQGEHYGDLDHNSTTSDPSDGYGLLLNGKNNGYIEGTLDHANLAATSPDATAEIKMHAGHVKIAAKDLDDWAAQLRDLSLKVLASKDNAAAADSISKSVALGDRFLNGIDLDGDESVDPVPGEAGAVIAYEHALYMADMPIFVGANAIPTPGSK
jgi:serine/threonine protein kinase